MILTHEQAKALSLSSIDTLEVIRRCVDLSMPDCYIDRWVDPVRGQYQAVYCRAYVPNNCPHPTERFPTTTTWRTRSVAATAMIGD